MAVTAKWYTLASSGQWGGSPVNWVTDTIRCALITSSYNPSQDTHQYFSTPQANETSGTGYTAGGMALTGNIVGGVTGTHTIPLKASSTVWNNVTLVCRYAVVYKDTGTASSSPLLGWVDFGSNQTVSSGTLSVAWDQTMGVLSLSAA